MSMRRVRRRVRAWAPWLLAAVAFGACADDGPTSDTARADALIREARALQARGQGDAAATLHRQVLALREARDPQDPALSESLNELALWHVDRREHAQAEALLARAQALLEQGGPARELDVARVAASRAQVCEALGRDEQARALNQQALTLYRAHEADGPAVWVAQAGVLNSLASAVYRKRRFKEAETLFMEALARMEQAVGTDDARLLPLLENLQALYRSQGRPGAGAVYAQRAAALRTTASGPSP